MAHTSFRSHLPYFDILVVVLSLVSSSLAVCRRHTLSSHRAYLLYLIHDALDPELEGQVRRGEWPVYEEAIKKIEDGIASYR